MNDRTFERIESLFDIALFARRHGSRRRMRLGRRQRRASARRCPESAISPSSTTTSSAPRTSSGMSAAGATSAQKKVDAVADVLLDRNPKANISEDRRRHHEPIRGSASEIARPTSSCSRPTTSRRATSSTISASATASPSSSAASSRGASAARCSPTGRPTAVVSPASKLPAAHTVPRGHPRDRPRVRRGARKGLWYGDRRDQGLARPHGRHHLHHLVPHPLCPRRHRAAAARAPQIPRSDQRKLPRLGQPARPPFNKHFQLQRIEISPQEQCAVCAARSVAHAV